MSKMGEYVMEQQQEEEDYQRDMAEAMQERYKCLIFALRQCVECGVKHDFIKTLIHETGAKYEDVYVTRLHEGSFFKSNGEIKW